MYDIKDSHEYTDQGPEKNILSLHYVFKQRFVSI